MPMFDFGSLKLKKEEKREDVIIKINDALNSLCKCEKEKDLQDKLGILLKCKTRQLLTSSIYPNAEIDVMGDNYTIETKYNDVYYAGISQVIIHKYLYEIKFVFLLHLHKYIDEKFIAAFKKLSEKINFIGLLIDQKNKKIMVFNND